MKIAVRTRLERRAVIDITSLIDLVFLLVAFFMITSSLGSESSIQVHLPEAVQSGAYEKGTLVISVDKESRVFINEKQYDLNEVPEFLDDYSRTHEKVSAVIRGDKSSRYEVIVAIIDSLNRAGIPRFSIATVK